MAAHTERARQFVVGGRSNLRVRFRQKSAQTILTSRGLAANQFIFRRVERPRHGNAFCVGQCASQRRVTPREQHGHSARRWRQRVVRRDNRAIQRHAFKETRAHGMVADDRTLPLHFSIRRAQRVVCVGGTFQFQQQLIQCPVPPLRLLALQGFTAQSFQTDIRQFRRARAFVQRAMRQSQIRFRLALQEHVLLLLPCRARRVQQFARAVPFAQLQAQHTPVMSRIRGFSRRVYLERNLQRLRVQLVRRFKVSRIGFDQPQDVERQTCRAPVAYRLTVRENAREQRARGFKIAERVRARREHVARDGGAEPMVKPFAQRNRFMSCGQQPVPRAQIVQRADHRDARNRFVVEVAARVLRLNGLRVQDERLVRFPFLPREIAQGAQRAPL